jgi:hypothetical protein
MTVNDSISRASGFAVAEESVAGTAETVPVVYDYLTDDPSIQANQNTMIHRSILSRTAHNASVASYSMSGTISTIAEPDGILGWLLKWAMGDVTSTQVGATTAYSHEFETTDSLDTFTTWFNRGTAQKIKMPYCMLDGIEFAQAVDDVLKVSCPFVGKTEEETADYGTPSYSLVTPFANANLLVYVDDVEVTEAHNSSISLSNNIDIGLGRVHGSRFYTALVPGDRTVTGSVDLYFNDSSMYRQFWGDTSATSPTEFVDPVNLKFNWDLGIEAGTAVDYELEIEIPKAVITNSTVSISGTRVVQTIDFEALWDETDETDIIATLVNKVTSY